MIHAFDTYYRETSARTVCLSFLNWEDADEHHVYVNETSVLSDYQSGSFFKRELPCIMAILPQVHIQPGDLILIDGYVILDDNMKPGLGYHLFKQLNDQYPVIGLAKHKYATLNTRCRTIYRGTSNKPLYVTTMSIDPDEVAQNIKHMHGPFRIPTLLKKLDQLTRITNTGVNGL